MRCFDQMNITYAVFCHFFLPSTTFAISWSEKGKGQILDNNFASEEKPNSPTPIEKKSVTRVNDAVKLTTQPSTNVTHLYKEKRKEAKKTSTRSILIEFSTLTQCTALHP